MEQLTTRPEHPALYEPGGEQIFREHASLRPYDRHTVIYAPGEPAAQAFMVGHGEVKISRCTADGRELTLEHLGPGDVFGEVELFLGRPRDSQAAARSDCVIHALDRETLFMLAAQESAFGLWLTQRVTERQARMESRLETLLFKSANGKVAEVLLHLADTYGEPARDGTLINYPITHQEIGNLVATTRETVSYAFMEFRQRGLISTHHRKTVVVDRDALEMVALD